MIDLNSLLVKVIAEPEQLSPLWPSGVYGEKNTASSLIFQSKAFLQAWAKTYGQRPDCQMLFIEVYQKDGTPLIFLPLALRSGPIASTLSFTDFDVSDYNAPVLFDDFSHWSNERILKLLDIIRNALPTIDIIDFRKMPQWIENRINPFFQIVHETNSESGHFSTLTQPWSQLEKNLHRIKNTKQRYRNLLSMDGFEFQIAQTSEERHAFIAALIKQKQRRFVETNVPGFQEHPEKQHFFEYATDYFGKAGTLHLAALKMHGEIISTLWGLIDGKNYFGMMISYEAEIWSKYSPGMVLHYLVMKDLHQKGFAILDLGVGDEAWKVNMCDGVRELRNYTCPITVRGQVFLTLKSLLALLRSTKIWSTIRPLKWKLLRLIKPFK